MVTALSMVNMSQSLWIVKTDLGIWAANPPYWFMPAIKLHKLVRKGLDIERTGLYEVDGDEFTFLRPQTPSIRWLADPAYKWDSITMDATKVICGRGEWGKIVTFDKQSILSWESARVFMAARHNNITYQYAEEERRIAIRNDELLGILGTITVPPEPVCDICGEPYTIQSYDTRSRITVTFCDQHRYLKLQPRSSLPA